VRLSLHSALVCLGRAMIRCFLTNFVHTLHPIFTFHPTVVVVVVAAAAAATIGTVVVVAIVETTTTSPETTIGG